MNLRNEDLFLIIDYQHSVVHCFHKAPRACSIQYGYTKCVTRARVLSSTVVHANCNNGIR